MLNREDLNVDQQSAISQFEKTGHLLIRGPRQSGKTTVLQWIIASQPAKYKIALIGLYATAQNFYDTMVQAESVFGHLNTSAITQITLQEAAVGYTDDPELQFLAEYDLVVFDGGILHPNPNFKTISAYCDEECLFVFGKAHTIKFLPLLETE